MQTLTTADYLSEAKPCFRQIFNSNAPLSIFFSFIEINEMGKYLSLNRLLS